MESLGSYIRSAARATYSAYRTVPVRWRLAGGSAALTFVILAAFAVIVALFTDSQVRKQFNSDVDSAASKLAHEAPVGPKPGGGLQCTDMRLVRDFSNSGEAQIRVYDLNSATTLCSAPDIDVAKAKPSC